MTIEEKTWNLLALDSGVSAYVPQERIKPPGDWEKLERPYIVHFPVAVNPSQMHDGPVQLTEWTYQVSVFCDTLQKGTGQIRGYGDCRLISKAVVAALRGEHDEVNYFWKDQSHQSEINPPIEHIAITFQVFEAL